MDPSTGLGVAVFCKYDRIELKSWGFFPTMAADITETDSSRALNAVNRDSLGFTGALVGALLVGLELRAFVGEVVGPEVNR